MKRVAKTAGVSRGVHILRHTFCSHLAMRGAAPRSIQALAGHSELGTTLRYMHLSEQALDAGYPAPGSGSWQQWGKGWGAEHHRAECLGKFRRSWR